MKNRSITFSQLLALAIFCMGTTFQAQAITLSFDDAGATGSAESFYSHLGVTFSGGGLLADGSSGGMPGQPVFTSYNGESQIGTLTKDSSGAYTDSFFDIWVDFSHDVFEVSGDYLGNLGVGSSVFAYDDMGNLLDSVVFSAPFAGTTNDVGFIGSFSFSNATAIAELHMLADSASAATLLDNLTFRPVPVPAAVWLFGSGLLGLIGFARRKSV